MKGVFGYGILQNLVYDLVSAFLHYRAAVQAALLKMVWPYGKVPWQLTK